MRSIILAYLFGSIFVTTNSFAQTAKQTITYSELTNVSPSSSELIVDISYPNATIIGIQKTKNASAGNGASATLRIFKKDQNGNWENIITGKDNAVYMNQLFQFVYCAYTVPEPGQYKVYGKGAASNSVPDGFVIAVLQPPISKSNPSHFDSWLPGDGEVK